MRHSISPAVIFTILFLLLFGCSRGPQISPLSPDAVILAFGDSLTYGTGAPREESYPAVLERLLGRRVINAGVPGEVSAEGRVRLPALLEEHRPALVILCHGGNDFLRRGDLEDLRRNMEEMIRIAEKAGAEVFLIGVPKPGIFLSAADLYEEIARAHHLPYQEEVLSDILGDRELKSDTVHPNARGYARMAEELSLRIPVRE